MSEPTVWAVSITFSEDEDHTRADAVLTGGPTELRGWGRARRSPNDPSLPAVGEEIAAARALGDLSHHLLEQAAHLIEAWEGHPVELEG
jgi:uncharacterized protein DUF1876